ncbi:hypothetical protein HaLaN_02745 [Haematococcus lacustris]|uniref:Uncharacterized protein n=1 Tax=Haematococcus lacustris TaxID=44745 RepID=A0A699YCQ5_HAELA|nr:hypothetical protein HaLaN_02745 [Haematococcus lacustris]
MWCPVVPPHKPPQAPRSSQEATPAAASEPGPSTPQPAKRSKRTKAEPAAEPTKGKGKGKAAKAKPAPQPGRWLDRDCNAALNMQRIGESRWRPLEAGSCAKSNQAGRELIDVLSATGLVATTGRGHGDMGQRTCRASTRTEHIIMSLTVYSLSHTSSCPNACHEFDHSPITLSFMAPAQATTPMHTWCWAGCEGAPRQPETSHRERCSYATWFKHGDGVGINHMPPHLLNIQLCT